MQKNIKKIISLGILSLLFFSPFISQAGFTTTSVITGTADGVSDIEATLHGTATPDLTLNPKLPTTIYFRYSDMTVAPVFCNDIYGSNMISTEDINLNLTGVGQSFHQKINNLNGSTKYYYCAIISNKNQIYYGTVKSFTTLPCPTCAQSTVTTISATFVDQTTATLRGSYSSTKNIKTYFEYKKDYTKNISGLATQYSGPNAIMSNPGLITPYSGMIGSITDPSLLTPYSGVLGIMSNPEIGISTPTTTLQNGWTKLNLSEQSHNSYSYGNTSFQLTGLKAGTKYNFRFVAETTDNPKGAFYGGTLSFTTSPSEGTGLIEVANINENVNDNVNDNGLDNNQTPLTLGQTATPPTDAIVRYQEGIETVFVRQIIASSDIAEKYGYVQGADLNAFAWNLADLLAKDFGYINSKGKEIRVSKPDIAAYELRLKDGVLIVYEYYNKKIVNIQKYSSIIKSKHNYEYYFYK